jgi:hypothetical protein
MADLLDDTHINRKKLKVSQRVFVTLLIVLTLCMWGALIWAMLEITSIIASGLLILAIGILLFILSLISKKMLFAFTSALAVFSVVFVALFIISYEISPLEAVGSVPFLILVCNSIVSLMSIVTLTVESFKRKVLKGNV